MLLTDLSRREGIGASAQYVELGPFRLLIDAGMDPKGVGLEATPQWDRIADQSLDFVFLTHCHLDHLGTLPMVLRRHPDAMVLASKASTMLAPRMLRNSANVMKRQRDELRIAEYPLYTFGEIDAIEGRMFSMNYGQPKRFEKHGEWLEVTFFRAGHIVGASGIRLVYKHRSIFFTGDVLFREQTILPGADFPDQPFDTLVMETTRGHTERASDITRASEVERLLTTIENTLGHGGSVLIPVFALGRMQELLTILSQARLQKRLPAVPVFCSGLGMDLVDYFDAIARKTSQLRFRRQCLKDLGVRKLGGSLRPGKDLAIKGIYLVSSGMMVANTPSYAVAASALDHPHNTVCFVGYCDPDTPGGKLLNTERDAPFVFEKLDHVARVRAAIERFDMSGHADRDELLNFALQAEPRSVVLTHGDPAARDWFLDALIEHMPRAQVTSPEYGKTYQI